jgi:phosphate starvation-inducible protein PhoH and related proteins
MAQKNNARLKVVYEKGRALTEIFGPGQCNLMALEDNLQIQAIGSGSSITLDGDPVAVNKAKEILDYLYNRAVKGFDVGPADMVPIKPKSGPAQSGVIQTKKKLITAKTKNQSALIDAMRSSSLTFATGPAGTGKTYLAVAYAAELWDRGEVEKIILSRPAVEAGERLGFLPGTLKDKIDPYLRPLYDALYDMLPPERIERGMVTGEIEVAPLAFMRGRTLTNAAIILDEAQNTTSMQMKMFLTRIGEGSRMVVTGDQTQTDLPRGTVSGLNEAVNLLYGVEEVSIVEFNAADVVRRALVGRIVSAYERSREVLL